MAQLRPNPTGIWVLSFHTLFQSIEEKERKQIFPHEGVTVSQFAELIAYFKQAGFHFHSPDSLWKNASTEGKHILLSFDDGYFNNTRALEVLTHYQVPALFSVSTAFIEKPKAFWWDVHYREESKKKRSFREILAEQNELKKLSFVEVDKEIIKRYGKEALKPIGELDRPFLPVELIEFAQSPWVSIGNHTSHHAILPNYSLAEVKKQILGAQNYLQELLGKAPTAIAYPNGNWTLEIVQLIAELDLKLGLSMVPGLLRKKEKGSPLILPRYQVFGSRSIQKQATILHHYTGSLKSIKNTILYPQKVSNIPTKKFNASS